MSQSLSNQDTPVNPLYISVSLLQKKNIHYLYIVVFVCGGESVLLTVLQVIWTQCC